MKNILHIFYTNYIIDWQIDYVVLIHWWLFYKHLYTKKHLFEKQTLLSYIDVFYRL